MTPPPISQVDADFYRCLSVQSVDAASSASGRVFRADEII